MRLAIESDVVVVDALFRTIGAALDLAAELRDRGCMARLVLVGDAAQSSPEAILHTAAGDVDAVVTGEVEPTVLALVSAADPEQAVPGAVIRRHDGLLLASPGTSGEFEPVVPPDRPHAHTAFSGRPVIDVVSSRGCASRCTFCMIGSAGSNEVRPGWRPRPAEQVAAEIRTVVEELGTTRVHFADDNFLGQHGVGARRADELATLLEPLAVRFSFYCRADSVDAGLFARLREAGLCQVHLGIEAGCDQTLRRLRKDQTTADIERALAVLRSLHIRIVPSFITFEARQSLEEMVESLRWMQTTDTEVGFGLSGSVPLPGTVMLAELLEQGLVSERSGWQQAYERVRFADGRVARVQGEMHRFEQAVETRSPGSTSRLASAYHDYNDSLEVVTGAPTPSAVSAHLAWRQLEVRVAIELAEILLADGGERSPEELGLWHSYVDEAVEIMQTVGTGEHR